MIELYLSIAEKLNEIEELKYIDIDGSEEIKTSPSAFISLGKIPWEQLTEGTMLGEFPFTVKVDITPYHRSAADTPEPVLTKLYESLDVIKLVKTKMLNEAITYITGVTLTGEDIKKHGGKFTLILDFKAQVNYEP
jgi:hypothetical protein